MVRLSVILCLLLTGCATPPGHPFGIWEGGMRMPDDQACSIQGQELLPCGAQR